MTRLKSMTLGIGVLALCVCTGCGGGGGGGVTGAGTTTTTTTMKEVAVPANTGTEGSFIYASVQEVAMKIKLPEANMPVLVYLKEPTETEAPTVLAQGISDNTGYFNTTITVPTAVTTLFVQPIPGCDPAAVTGKIVVTSNGYGTLKNADGSADVTFAWNP